MGSVDPLCVAYTRAIQSRLLVIDLPTVSDDVVTTVLLLLAGTSSARGGAC